MGEADQLRAQRGDLEGEFIDTARRGIDVVASRRRQLGPRERVATRFGEQRGNGWAALLEQLGVDALLPAPPLIHQPAIQPTQDRGSPPRAPLGIQDSGNRLSNNSVRSNCASARSVLARFFGPRNTAISAGSPTCTPMPAAADLAQTIPPPGAALQRELAITIRAVLGQPAPQRTTRGRTNPTPPHHTVVIHVIERDLLPVHVKATYDCHRTSSSS